MAKSQFKCTISNRHVIMSSLEIKYFTTAHPDYSNIAEGKEKDPKSKYMKMTEVFKGEWINKSLKETKKKS